MVIFLGNEIFDSFIGGGFECGLSILILGFVGMGKLFFVLIFVVVLVVCGEYVVMFVFDEEFGLFCDWVKGFGIDV